MNILADYAANIHKPSTEEDLNKRYLFVVIPQQDEDSNEDVWTGTVNKITIITKQFIDKLHDKLSKKFALVESFKQDVSSKVDAVKGEVAAVKELVDTKFDAVNVKVDGMQ